MHTGLYSEDINKIAWNKTKENLKIYLLGLNYEKIDNIAWNEAYKSRSFRFVLPYNYKIGDIYLLLGIPKKADEFLNEYVDTIIVPTASNNQIFIGNSKQHEYFSLKGLNRKNEFELSSIINNIEKSNIIEYKRLEDMYSLRNLLGKKDDPKFIENTTIAPITSIPNIPYINVSFSYDSIDMKLYAEKVFDDNFNFVKKIHDVDNSLIYMYGYGEKILTFFEDGSLEYSQKIKTEDNNVVDKNTIVDNINIALNSIKKFGEISSTLYLAKYEENNNDFTLWFNYRIKDYNVFSDDIEGGYAYKIEIEKGKVKYFKKSFKKYIGSSKISSKIAKSKSFDQVIEKNIDVILSRYIREKGIILNNDNKNEIIISILQDINNIDIDYFNSRNNVTNRMIPIWKIKILDTVYCFDLYGGNILYISNSQSK
ncbi:hypothetical protein HLPR_27290 [Helicovermis profundi]|uniref:Uncharacterized protein n=1 Tax=Helicovermis profundi TaxID=3065157 RepID=A0AAU9E7C0_9FIRM|nr:hypothetical protein HLPR_27290 [Clostridia bacterium S502]